MGDFGDVGIDLSILLTDTDILVSVIGICRTLALSSLRTAPESNLFSLDKVCTQIYLRVTEILLDQIHVMRREPLRA